MLWVGCKVPKLLLKSQSAKGGSTSHSHPDPVLPTPLEPQQRLTLPETCRHSLSLGTHLPTPPCSSWYRRAVPTLAELWTDGQPQPMGASMYGSAQVIGAWLGAGVSEGCHGSRERGPK